MKKQNYEWVRFWAKRGSQLNYDEHGFLYDPSLNDFYKSYNPDLITKEEFISTPCIVFLGEPGSGKSTELSKIITFTQEIIRGTNSKIITFDLKDYSSDTLFNDLVFNSPDFLDWVNGDYDLYFFLDSLDEGIITIKKIANLLSIQMNKLPHERLYFRIACRNADWPKSLNDSLIGIWGESNTQILVISPLSKRDIEIVLSANDIEPKLFINEIVQKEIVPLAIFPITLFILVDEFITHKKLPQQKNALYEIGCLKFCDELNPSRRESKQIGTLSPKGKMLIAGRIASLLLLTNKNSISTIPQNIFSADARLPLHDAIGYFEEIDGLSLQVAAAEIYETISTGLFYSIGEGDFRFIHQTYAEFLAAWYLRHHNLSKEQLTSLLFQSFDGSLKIIPQLRYLVSWLITYYPFLIEILIENDPSIILLGENEEINDFQKAKVVKKILDLFETEKLYPSLENIDQKYSKLFFPGISEELSKFIIDKSKSYSARSAAIEIASSCNLINVLNELVNISLDQNEEIGLRKIAGYAIVEIGDDGTKKKLIQLALGESGDDPFDELKGVGLLSVWPDSINSKILFSTLTPPKQSNYWGAYKSFLNRVINDFNNVDLHEALKWARKQTKNEKLSNEFESLIDETIIYSWYSIEDDQKIPLLAAVILNRINNFNTIIFERSFSEKAKKKQFYDSFRNNQTKRYKILKEIFKIYKTSKIFDWSHLLFNDPLIFQEDLEWLANQINSYEDRKTKEVFAEIIIRIVDINNNEHLNIIYDISQNYPEFSDIFKFYLGPIPFDSPEIKHLRDHYQWEQNQIKKQDKLNLKNKEIYNLSTIERMLGDIEKGELNEWWKLNHLLAGWNNNAFSYVYRDISDTPGWKDLDNKTHERIYECAKKYVINAIDEIEKWFLINQIFFPTLAAYRALYLLCKKDKEFINRINIGVIEKWIPIIINQTKDSYKEGDEIHNIILQKIYRDSPKSVILYINQMIDHENEYSKNVSFLNFFEKINDEFFNDFLLSKTQDEALQQDSYQAILFALQKNNYLPALEMCINVIDKSISEGVNFHTKTLCAIKGLILYQPKIGWGKFIKVMTTNPSQCEEIILSLPTLHGRKTGNLFDYLTENQILSILIWIYSTFPSEKDIIHNNGDFFTVTQRDEIGWWRNDQVVGLSKMGTFTSLLALRRLSAINPSITWIKHQVTDAEISYRRNNWTPTTPDEILELIQNSKLRIIQDYYQLNDLVMESLQRLQEELQGETPGVQFLWNENDGEYNPKDENSLSDYTKKFLEHDLQKSGIIINREVEIIKTQASSKGQKTDIQINILNNKSGYPEVISLIIETKCLWNKELFTGIKNQLFNRYLAKGKYNTGIYLVGWYQNDKWDKKDKRFAICNKYKKQDVEIKLINQLTNLPSENKLVKFYILDASY